MKKTIFRAVLLLLCLLCAAQPVSAVELLIPGGQVIGLQLTDDTVTVASFDPQLGQPARDAGLQAGDRIISIDTAQIRSAQDVRAALDRSDGSVQLQILRGGKTKKIKLQPVITGDGPRLGVYLKEGIAGIGTVTWYDEDGSTFGALGHGVNNQSGDLVDMKAGSVFSAAVVSVRKGKCGDPGQLMGTLTAKEPIGTLRKNTSKQASASRFSELK